MANPPGPFVGADGRILGLVTRDFAESFDDESTGRHVSLFSAGVPTSAIQRALSEIGGYENLLPTETFLAGP
jgi:hypothetical protein